MKRIFGFHRSGHRSGDRRQRETGASGVFREKQKGGFRESSLLGGLDIVRRKCKCPSAFFQLCVILVIVGDGLNTLVEIEQSVVFIGRVDVVGIESEAHENAVHIEYIFEQ